MTQVIRILVWPMSQYLHTHKLFTFINKRYGRFSPTPRLWSLCFRIYLFKLKSIILWYISKNNSKQYIDCDVTYLPKFPSNENQCGWYRRKGSDRRRLCQLELSLSTTHRLGSPPLFRPRLLVAIYWSPRPPSSAAIMIKGARAAPDFLSL